MTTLIDLGLTKERGRFLRYIVCSLIIFLLMCMAAAGSLLAGEPLSRAAESDLKAVYIFNFIRFTDWPEDHQKQMDGHLRLNVLDDHAVHDAIKAISRKQSARQMGLEVQACSTISCLEQSSVLFIGQSDSDEFHYVLKLLQGRPVLTISDIPGFASHGGMIEIRQREKRLGFIINLKAVKQSNLYISAQLLQLADRIEEAQ